MSSVLPRGSGGSAGSEAPGADELEQLEELGDDAIIAQQSAAHVPKPRAQVVDEARSVVIAAGAPPGRKPPSERTDKTLVIRDRRELDALRREIARRKPGGSRRNLWVWAAVGVAAFIVGGLAALLATQSDSAPAVAEPAAVVAPAPASAKPPEAPQAPAVSIDELPVEDSRTPRR